MENSIKIGPRIRAARERRGWTQNGLAIKLGVTKAEVCRLEGISGAGIQLSTVERVARALGITLYDLLGGK